MSEFYWELVTFEGDIVPIPPDAVAMVKRRMGNKEPIHTKTATIPSNQIKSLRMTDKAYMPQHLIEDVSRAFNEPVLTAEGNMQTRWVKKSVTPDRWNRYYSHHPYRRLSDDGSMVLVAFKLPVHLIDLTRVTYCDEDEIQRILTRN